MKKYLFAIALFCLQFLYALPTPGGAGGSTPGTRTTPIDSNIWILVAAAVIMMGYYAYRQASRKLN